MSDFLKVRVLGVAQATKNFKELSAKLQNQITRKAVRAATQIIADQVKGTTYGAGRQQRTGRLQKAMALSVSKKRDVFTGKVLSRAVHLVRGDKADDAFYWRFLEGGTKDRQTRKGANRGHVTPRPWVEPAFESSADRAISKFAEVFSREVEAAVQSLNTTPPRS